MIAALRDYHPDLPQLALLAANLLPVFGVLYADWDVGTVVLLYWAENIIAGAFTLLKMFVTGRFSALKYALFFCLHYGIFCAIHGMFVLKLTGFSGIEDRTSTYSWPGPLVVPEMLADLIARILHNAPEQFLWACLALLLSHGVSFLLLFIGQGEFRRTTVRVLMRAPYQRITVLHIAVIAGAFLIQALGSPLALLLALVALKIAMDIMLHIRAHRDENRPEYQAKPVYASATRPLSGQHGTGED